MRLRNWYEIRSRLNLEKLKFSAEAQILVGGFHTKFSLLTKFWLWLCCDLWLVNNFQKNHVFQKKIELFSKLWIFQIFNGFWMFFTTNTTRYALLLNKMVWCMYHVNCCAPHSQTAGLSAVKLLISKPGRGCPRIARLALFSSLLRWNSSNCQC